MEKNIASNRSVFTFFVATFVFSWLFWLPGLLSSLGLFQIPVPNMVWVILGAHGPLFAALGLTYREDGWAGVKKLLRKGFDLRMKPIWWLLIVMLSFVLAGLAVGVNVFLSGYQPDQTLLLQPLMILPTFLVMFFVGGSFQEEFGWRGYALPRLLEKWNPAIASLILGTVWGFWHLPLFYIQGASQVFMPFGVFLMLAIAFSVLFTWFFQRTSGNLFSALLFHTAINTSFSIFPPVELQVNGNQMAFAYLMIAYGIVALVILMINRQTWFGR